MKALMMRLVMLMLFLGIVGCGGSSGDGSSGPTAPSGPFNGTFSANNAVTPGAVDTLVVTASGIAISGTLTTRSSQGTVTGSVSGLFFGDHASVQIIYSSSSSFNAVLQLNGSGSGSGSGFTMSFTSAQGVAETETFTAGSTPPALSAEAYCATLPSVGFGHLFYCGTTQANLQKAKFPDGSLGFCQSASESLGLVGYVPITFNGGIGVVETQSEASADCKLIGPQCEGYIMCTRQ